MCMYVIPKLYQQPTQWVPHNMAVIVAHTDNLPNYYCCNVLTRN